jgi:hypothetical protein
MIRRSTRQARAVFRWWTWQRVAALGLFLLGLMVPITATTNYADERNEHENDAADRAVIADLIDELRCYRRASAPAAALEAEMARQGWLGLAELFLAPGPDQARAEQLAGQRAEAIRELGDRLGGEGDSVGHGQIDERLQASTDCEDGDVDDSPLSPP